MSVTFRLRRDTAGNWATVNPVLALGEPGYETTSRKMKIGDGATAWDDLGYVEGATPADLGTMAEQDADNVAITGGHVSVDGYGRTATQKGFLDGGFTGALTLQMPIFCINASFGPVSQNDLGNMYGVGYTEVTSGLTLPPGAQGWGFYVAAAGAASVFLDGQYGHVVGTGMGRFGTWVRPGSYTVAGVPSAATAGPGAMIYVSNESGGPVPAFSDGSNWRRVTDRAIIS